MRENALIFAIHDLRGMAKCSRWGAPDSLNKGHLGITGLGARVSRSAYVLVDFFSDFLVQVTLARKQRAKWYVTTAEAFGDILKNWLTGAHIADRK